jgi:hypothetical protein
MAHPVPEQIYPLILEDYFFSLVDCGVPADETPLFTGNLEGEALTSAVGRRFASPIKKLFCTLRTLERR